MKVKHLLLGSHGRRRGLFASVAAGTLGLGLGIAAPTGASASQPQALSPVHLGLDATESGALAPYSAGSVQYFQAWIDHVNAHGGVLGRKVDLTVLDNKGDPAQALLNFETLWSQDHVDAIAERASPGQAIPYSYIQSKKIPTFIFGGTPQTFASSYPTIINSGGEGPAWSAQTAYYVVHVLNKHPKVVAVDYSGANSTWNSFIKNYWTKLGAKTVDFEPDGGPTANCTPLVLKFRAEGVQYLDMQGPEGAGPCIEAEQQLGWRPVDGQGGPIASEIGQAELIGKPMVGVIAGSPNTLYTGAPIYSSPTAADKTYVGDIQKYVPSLANYSFLNGTNTLDTYGLAQLVTHDLEGTLQKYGKITPALLADYSEHVTDYSNGLQPPIASFAPSCKTGSDRTIWGHWAYNAHPTSIRPLLYLAANSGPKWIENKWLGLPKCYLTQEANRSSRTGEHRLASSYSGG